MKIGKLLESIAKSLESIFNIFKEFGETLFDFAEDNVQVYWIGLKKIANFYILLWEIRWVLFTIAVIAHMIGLSFIGAGLHYGNGISIAIGGGLLLVFWVLFLGIFELTGQVIKVLASSAETNTDIYNKLIRWLAPGETPASERPTGKDILDLSGIKSFMSQIKSARAAILPFLVAACYMILIPSWWTLGVATMVLAITFIRAWFASTQGYDMSKSIRFTFALTGLIIPAIIVLAIVPEMRQGAGGFITDIRSSLGGNGLEKFEGEQKIVFVTPVNPILARDNSGKATGDTLRPGYRMAFVGITTSEFKLGELPELKNAENGLQKLIEYYESEMDGYLAPKGTFLAQSNFELYSKYQERAEKTKPEPEKKSDEEVLQEKPGETGQVALSTDVGEVKWVNPKEAIITVYPSKTFPTMIYLAQDTEFYYYASGSGCEYVSSSVGRQPISESGTILYAYDPKTHLVVSNSSNQTQQIRLVIVKGGTINS